MAKEKKKGKRTTPRAVQLAYVMMGVGFFTIILSMGFSYVKYASEILIAIGTVLAMIGIIIERASR